MTFRRPAGYSRTALARALADRFDSPFLRHYARAKIASDPLYEAVAGWLAGDLPVLDVGCGAGLMAMFLRQAGFVAPITGIDHDARKIAAARRAAAHVEPPIHFVCADARGLPAHSGSVLLLDVLHYMTSVEVASVLTQTASRIAAGGAAIVREGIDDGSWRYRATLAGEVLARAVRWTRAERLRFPAAEEIRAPFDGFEISVEAAYGGTPFNNHLFVFRK